MPGENKAWAHAPGNFPAGRVQCCIRAVSGKTEGMKSNPFLSRVLAALGAMVLIAVPARAQSGGTVNDAFQIARDQVPAAAQTKVVSLYGIGTPSTISKWYIIFYDPTVPTHGRVVLVENGKVSRTYAANGGKTYAESLSFDPSRITNEGPALSAAQGYAGKHHIAYDSVKALLNETPKKPFRWKIELVATGESKGYVYVNALDDTVAAYSSPTANSTGKTADSAPKTAAGLGTQVKDTFLGIGGDLQEFFTGERTVDK